MSMSKAFFKTQRLYSQYAFAAAFSVCFIRRYKRALREFSRQLRLDYLKAERHERISLSRIRGKRRQPAAFTFKTLKIYLRQRHAVLIHRAFR